MDKSNEYTALISEAVLLLEKAMAIQDGLPESTQNKMAYNGIVAAISYCRSSIQITTHANPNPITNRVSAAAVAGR